MNAVFIVAIIVGTLLMPFRLWEWSALAFIVATFAGISRKRYS
jgi:hypothetical protein